MVVLLNWEIIDIRPVRLLASSNFSHIALSFLLPRLLSMAEPQPYSGPIFDVQAHAIKPSGYEAVATGIRNKTSLKGKGELWQPLLIISAKNWPMTCRGAPPGSPRQGHDSSGHCQHVLSPYTFGKITRDRQ